MENNKKDKNQNVAADVTEEVVLNTEAEAEKEVKEVKAVKEEKTEEAAKAEKPAEKQPSVNDYKLHKSLIGGKAANRIINVLLVLGCLTILFPLYMTVIIAFKQPTEMTNDVAGALAFPSQWSFDNFREAMRVTDFWHSLGNSFLLTGVTVVICILLHSVAGYVIGRKMEKHSVFKISYFYIVSGMFVPFAVLMMPLIKQTAQLGIANRVGVIILYVVFFMPMNMMLYTSYLKNIPVALEEAAYVDGATAWQTFWKIIFPNMKPMHATVAVLTAMSTWNDVMTPLVIMSGTDQNTLPLAQLNFQTQFGTNYNLAFASYLLALLPIMLFYIICQRQIINGVVNGAVK